MDGYQDQLGRQRSSASPIRPSKQKSSVWESTNIDLSLRWAEAVDGNPHYISNAFSPLNAKSRHPATLIDSKSLAPIRLSLASCMHFAPAGLGTGIFGVEAR